MPTVHNITYSTTNTNVTITVANLSNAAARSSASISNATNLFFDVSLRVQIGVGTTTGTDQAIYIYGYGSEDSVAFGGQTSGTDAAIVTTPTNLPLLGVISCANPPFTSSNLTLYIGSFANSFGGNMPKYWGIAIDNRSGGSLVNTAANHVVTYTGIYATST